MQALTAPAPARSAQEAPLPIARAWYHALYSDELPPGGVKPLRYVARDLVAFRGEDGEVALVDAHCPHLGAHLGVGGQVVGNALRCPFHGWEWERSGRCRRIPYAKRVPEAARLRAWPTLERNGVVWFWYDPGGGPPRFDVPEISEFGDPAWASTWDRHDWTLRTHPQEILENGIDWPHVVPVHGFEVPSEVVCHFDGPRYHWGADTGKDIELLEGRSEAFSVRVDTWGLGLSQVRYRGLFSTIFQIGHTPVDEWHTKLTFGILTRRQDHAAPEIAQALRAYTADQIRTLEQDFPIWENKRYRAQPLLCDSDGPIHDFRRWAQSFYAP
jgi:nitrite reductase/ring-hydroxylating ferredoxin subunit